MIEYKLDKRKICIWIFKAAFCQSFLGEKQYIEYKKLFRFFFCSNWWLTFSPSRGHCSIVKWFRDPKLRI